MEELMPTDTALILGASKGLGAEIARAYHDDCWVETIELASSINDGNPRGRLASRTMLRCNLADRASVRMTLCKLEHRRVTFNRFFWVAGTWWEGEFAEMSPEEMLRLIDVNFRNAVLVAHWAWRALQSASRATAYPPSTYTVIGSTSGVRPRKHQEVYAATKHAQVGFARSLGESNPNPNVHVSLFVLGGMRTHLFDRKPPAAYAEFMDPAKVAAHIVARVAEQRDPYLEQEITRDSSLGQSLR